MTPGNDISNGFPSESSSNLLNSIIKIIPDAAVILDFDGKIIECNQLVCNMIGKERAEIIGLSYQAVGLFSETDFSQYMKLVETMQYDKGYPEREIEWIAPSGNIRKSEVHLGLLNLQPLPQSIIAIARDVSTRYSIEERLKNEREAFHLIAEAAIESMRKEHCDFMIKMRMFSYPQVLLEFQLKKVQCNQLYH
jgi:PAS domain S-box-containing protein